MSMIDLDKQKEWEFVAYKYHERMVLLGYLPACTNCGHWDKKAEICAEYKVRPPANVIAVSCGGKWVDDIPF